MAATQNHRRVGLREPGAGLFGLVREVREGFVEGTGWGRTGADDTLQWGVSYGAFRPQAMFAPFPKCQGKLLRDRAGEGVARPGLHVTRWFLVPGGEWPVGEPEGNGEPA